MHQRFSTNTFPSWQLAHPYRYLCHNGEINTVRGNVNWMHARQKVLASELYGDDLKKIFPVIAAGGSDSASLDNAVEALTLAGRSLPHVMAMLIPEAWDGDGAMHPDKKGVLRISRLADGALGWSGRGSVHGWPRNRRNSGSQWSAACALSRNSRRPADHGVRNRRAAGAPRKK